jgi:hypothetical protein
METTMRRRAYWLGKEDEQAIVVIRQRYGCASDSQALRMALRSLAESKRLDFITIPSPPKHARSSPKQERSRKSRISQNS